MCSSAFKNTEASFSADVIYMDVRSRGFAEQVVGRVVAHVDYKTCYQKQGDCNFPSVFETVEGIVWSITNVGKI